VALNHNYIGTEPLLLGLFGDRDSIGAKVLTELGASHDVVRDRMLEFLASFGQG
jgi:hypothetical protein